MSAYRFVPTRGTGAVLTAAALLSLNGLPNPHPDTLRTRVEAAAEQQATAEQAKAAHERDARVAVASRFASCVITGVHSGANHPSHNVNPNTAPRTHLEVSVQLTDTLAAQAAMQEYDQDDSVTWSHPLVKASVLSKGQLIPNASMMPKYNDTGENGSTFGDYNMSPTGKFTPHNVYANGTKAGVFVSQDAETTEGASEGFNTTRTVGETFCGALVVKNGVWVAEIAHPTVLPDTLVTTTN